MIRSLIKEDMDFVREGNIFHFLKDDASRPAWSRALDEYVTGNHINLMMKRKYSGQKRRTWATIRSCAPRREAPSRARPFPSWDV